MTWGGKTLRSSADALKTLITDLARGFIRAEVISYDALIAAGNLAAARQKGMGAFQMS